MRESIICVVREEKGDEFKKKLSNAGQKTERSILKAMASYNSMEVPNEYIAQKIGMLEHDIEELKKRKQ